MNARVAGPELKPAVEPTLYFIGVTTSKSSILPLFPKWAAVLRLGSYRIVGIDLPLHAPGDVYRRVVSFIKSDRYSRGALITTHKIDLFAACRDLFDEVDPLAQTMGELSCLSKRGDRLIASAKDPISAGLAIDAFLPARHFTEIGGELFCMGAGGSTIAITWHLMHPRRGQDRPSRVVVSNRSRPRLDSIRSIHETFGFGVPIEYALAEHPQDNDQVMAGLKPGSLVVNATGLGKDALGSPVTDAARFPHGGFAWELNYRGDLVFLRQAMAAARKQSLTVEDGWIYFIHGWTSVIAEVFAIDIPSSGPRFDRLVEVAGGSPLKAIAS
jgi:shikimate 5-dehydrogenase